MRQLPGRFGSLIVLISLWVGVSTVFAQPDSISIQYGETVSGVITDEVPCQYYRFEGTSGDVITLDMRRTSGSLDGVMALYWHDDFTRAPIANNDDRSGGGLDPLIEHTLPETTWYTVAACRLQADQMRVTIGEYTLTLIGPGADDPAAVTQAPPDTAAGSGDASETGESTPAAPLGNLSDGIFGSGTAATPTATPLPSLAEGLLGGAETLSDGGVVTGELAADAELVTYRLPVVAGDVIVIEWLRIDGDVAPQLRITGGDGRVLALTSTPDAVSGLSLALLAPVDDTLTITVARHGSVIDAPVVDGTAGTFTLEVGVFP